MVESIFWNMGCYVSIVLLLELSFLGLALKAGAVILLCGYDLINHDLWGSRLYHRG